MRRSYALTGLLLAGLALAPFAVGAPKAPKETKEQRKARKAAEKELKKVKKKLPKVLVAIQRAKPEQVDQYREIGTKMIQQLEKINHPVCADYILELAPRCEDHELFVQLRDTLAFLDSDEVAKHLTARLKSMTEKKPDKKLRVTWEQKIIILQAFRSLKGEAVNEGTAIALADINMNVLRLAVRIAGSKEDKRVVSALIDLLEKVEKTGGNIYFSCRQSLVDLTGEDFFTHGKWKGWWEENKAKFDFKEKGNKKVFGTVERKGEEKPEFFGSEVKSNRVLFVIDTSGSMIMTDPPEDYDKSLDEYEKTPLVQERQRMERAREALRKAVKNLLPTQYFNIMRYSSAVDSWQRQDKLLVPATPQNKASALNFVDKLQYGGATYTHLALQRAFAYTDVDEIYFLSDGSPQPQARKIGNPGPQQVAFDKEEINRILKDVQKWNRFRKVKINTFGFTGPGAWHIRQLGPRGVTLPKKPEFIRHFGEFMNDLAKVTGGQAIKLS